MNFVFFWIFFSSNADTTVTQCECFSCCRCYGAREDFFIIWSAKGAMLCDVRLLKRRGVCVPHMADWTPEWRSSNLREKMINLLLLSLSETGFSSLEIWNSPKFMTFPKQVLRQKLVFYWKSFSISVFTHFCAKYC